MEISKAEQSTFFSQPIRQIVTMLLAVALVCAGAWLIHDTVIGIIATNPLLNGFIVMVFALGVAACFWQVITLMQSVSWIERFARHETGSENAAPPRLLAPLAHLLRTRGARMQISSSASRSILESVETRIDEARDITRYLTNLLVFLGLLGTFYGLATTVPAIVETIRSLAPQQGESGMEVFSKLMKGLESQLGGMGTAFSSSLLGLAGSLVVGLLELFASHGQNRFARELEEWLSSITRVGFSTGEAEGGEAGVTSAVLDHLAEQIEVMQSLFAQVEANRSGVEHGLEGLEAGLGDLRQGLGDLTAAVAQLGQFLHRPSGQAAALNRIAEGQERLIAALTGAEGGAHSDAESRMRLRSIDVQLLRILEEISAGRQESLADLRGDISALTASVRQLARGIPARG
ncbi:biopolymer transporter ExbB [Cypionkella sp.]|uniref:biopolymer transporter ExbB n=1 Tax=Cypionkella sp. TaxID=2811411 RepID=UPI002ABB2DD1|nr:biopolymer transporter ExbB [Cypionkella sp.]MDZ4392909.1 biopolymer transporter ExbB [Cypionkella sp.]